MFITGCADKPESQIAEYTRGTRRTPEERAKTTVDIDLTELSATVLSAELTNIIINGGDYLGKTIRVSGFYNYLFYDELNTYYHFVITKDGDACCQEGLEFKWNGDHVFPDDYPSVRVPIEVDGVLSICEERNMRFYYLAVDDIFISG